MVVRVSCLVGVATSADTNVMLPASCRHEIVPNVLRGVVNHGRISRRMRATGEEGAEPIGLPRACRHAKAKTCVARVDSPLLPWARLDPR
jgi:hypothetical protein